MVISYQGARSKPPKFTPQALQVKDFMTKQLICFEPDQYMHEAIQTLLDKKISGAPVLDKEGNLIGILSEGDCLKEVVKGKYNNSPSLMGTVSEYMTKNPVTVKPDDNILEVANFFLERRLRRFPVLENGKLVGQISQRDIMDAVQNLKNETW